MLKVNNLSMEYTIEDKKLKALDGVSFDVADGEIVGIIGRSGSGKTTLMNVLHGVEPFIGGDIELDGITVRHDSSDEDFDTLKKETAYHQQRAFGLWTGSVVENIIRKLNLERDGTESLPRKNSPHFQPLYDEAMEYVKLVGLERKAEHNTAVLSGGEKQMVLIARQLAAKPKAFLLDEPATMTGPDTKQEILDTIKNVCKKLNVATIIVSHLPEIHAYLAERLVWIENGKVVMDGKPMDVLKEFMKGIEPQVQLAKPLYDDVLIQVKDIKQRFWLIRAGKVLEIDEMNIDFKHGEITSIIGPSGAGKTTILKAIGGIAFPKEGEVLYAHDEDWLDILKYSPARMGLRNRISIMFQEFALGPHSTIKSQIAYKLGVKSQEVLEKAIEKSRELGMSNEVLDKIYQLTDSTPEDASEALAKLGYTPEIFNVLFPSYPIAEAVKYAEPVFKAVDLPLNVLDKYAYQLSGGEKVRTSLAMALATRPDFLLLDEPFGDLDPKTLRDVSNSLKTINREFGTTIIIVSHHMDFVREVSHRAILIDAGAIIADGDANTVCDELVKRSNAPYLEHDLREFEESNQ